MVSKFRLDTSKNATTKETITRSLEVVNNYAGELTIEVLPLSKVELDPENKREMVLTIADAINGISKSDPDYIKKKQDWKSLETLAKTIKDDQLINPIFVYRFGNKCRLIAGERRTLASAIAGKNEIIARIASKRPVGTKLMALQWIENNERSDLNLVERMASIEAIVNEYHKENKTNKITAKTLGEITGISITQARRYILVLQCDPEIKKAISEKLLENLKLVELLCLIENPEHRKELLDAAIGGASVEEILKLKSTFKETKNPAKGRKKHSINFGKVKANVAKVMVEALSASSILEASISTQINNIYNSHQWDDNKSIEKSFKEILLLLEKVVKAQQ